MTGEELIQLCEDISFRIRVECEARYSSDTWVIHLTDRRDELSPWSLHVSGITVTCSSPQMMLQLIKNHLLQWLNERYINKWFSYRGDFIWDNEGFWKSSVVGSEPITREKMEFLLKSYTT